MRLYALFHKVNTRLWLKSECCGLPLNIGRPQKFPIADIGHPHSTSWLRVCYCCYSPVGSVGGAEGIVHIHITQLRERRTESLDILRLGLHLAASKTIENKESLSWHIIQKIYWGIKESLSWDIIKKTIGNKESLSWANLSTSKTI